MFPGGKDSQHCFQALDFPHFCHVEAYTAPSESLSFSPFTTPAKQEEKFLFSFVFYLVFVDVDVDADVDVDVVVVGKLRHTVTLKNFELQNKGK